MRRWWMRKESTSTLDLKTHSRTRLKVIDTLVGFVSVFSSFMSFNSWMKCSVYYVSRWIRVWLIHKRPPRWCYCRAVCIVVCHWRSAESRSRREMTSDGELRADWKISARVIVAVRCCRDLSRWFWASRRARILLLSRRLSQCLRCIECRIWWNTSSWSSRECKCRELENAFRAHLGVVWDGQHERLNRGKLKCRGF